MEPEAAAQIAMPHRSVPAAHAIDERATPWTWAARQAEPGVPSATAKTRLWFYVFLFALMAVPYGISNAIIAVIIPYRMRLSGYSVEQIGLFFSILMAPTYLQFVYSPLADWRFSKRTWVILSAVASAVCFALPEYWAKSNHYSPLVLAVVLLGQVASGLFLCSLGALISTLFTGRARDHAASCRVAGTFAGNLLGTVLALRPEGTASPLTNAALFGLLTLVPALFVLCLPVPVEPQPDASGHIVHDLRQFRRDPRFWITLLLSVSPSCAAGLLGLFSALAVDFRATPGHVVLANGTLGSLSMVLGSMLAGPLSGWGDRRTLYVACNHKGTLQVWDAESLTMRAEITVGAGAYNVEPSPDGRFVVVTNKKAQSASVVDARTLKELARVPTTKKIVHGVAFSPDSRYAYVTQESIGADPGAVDVIDLTTLTKVSTTPLPAQPTGITILKR